MPPEKYDRCVEDVSKSLKKYHRKGNPYAICSKLRNKKEFGEGIAKDMEKERHHYA